MATTQAAAWWSRAPAARRHHRASGDPGASRQVHRRGAVADRHLRRTGGGRTGWQRIPVPVAGPAASRAAAHASRRRLATGATTVRSRLIVGAVRLRAVDRRHRSAAALSAGVPARRMVARAARQRQNTHRGAGAPRRHRRSQRARRSPTASTPIRSSPTRPKSRIPTASPRRSARALDRCDAAERAAIAKSLRRKGQFA